MSSPYGSAADWSQIISGAVQGAGSGMQGASAYATSKDEAKEAKRRTLANLLNNSRRRNQHLFKSGQEHGDEMSDFRSQALQQVARGFIESLQGSSLG